MHNFQNYSFYGTVVYMSFTSYNWYLKFWCWTWKSTQLCKEIKNNISPLNSTKKLRIWWYCIFQMGMCSVPVTQNVCSPKQVLFWRTSLSPRTAAQSLYHSGSDDSGVTDILLSLGYTPLVSLKPTTSRQRTWGHAYHLKYPSYMLLNPGTAFCILQSINLISRNTFKYMCISWFVSANLCACLCVCVYI